jgi:hypothetical protein
MTDELDLIDLLEELRDRYGKCPSYPRVWRGAVGGSIPAFRARDGRWRVKITDLEAIARTYKLAA